jgi:hypothetical protein
MAARLGDFLHLAAGALAILWLLLCVVLILGEVLAVPSSIGDLMLVLIPALLIWLTGRGLRYFMSGY